VSRPLPAAPARALARACALALVLAFALACAAPHAAPALPAAPGARATPPGAAQLRYLALARVGVARAEQRWRDHRRGWYDARLNDGQRYPLATIWDIVPLFESLDAIAIAQPTTADRRAVSVFAAGAERYLNRGLRPLPGYSPYQGDREASTQTWFDDNGWWGLAFVNAYRATGSRRYLADAARALSYIAAAGWDAQDGGGIWWNTGHPYRAGEALASATLLATLLYEQTRSPFALAQARRFIAWADTAGFSAADGLYAGSSLDATPVDYIEAPLIYARALLCGLAGPPRNAKAPSASSAWRSIASGAGSTSPRSTTRSTCNCRFSVQYPVPARRGTAARRLPPRQVPPDPGAPRAAQRRDSPLGEPPALEWGQRHRRKAPQTLASL
jgi:hypothetical protein